MSEHDWKRIDIEWYKCSTCGDQISALANNAATKYGCNGAPGSVEPAPAISIKERLLSMTEQDWEMIGLKVTVAQQAQMIEHLRGEPTPLYTAVDMATAAADGFRDGAASERQRRWDGNEISAREHAKYIAKFQAENEALRQENERLREGRPVYKSAFYKFPEKLLRLRLEKGLSQRDLSAMTGMSCPLISMYETGRTKPGMKNILRLEKALDCPGAFQGASHD